MPVSNPYLTDKFIDEEMTPLLDMQINNSRKWSPYATLDLAYITDEFSVE